MLAATLPRGMRKRSRVKKPLMLAAIAMLAVSLGGCGTIFNLVPRGHGMREDFGQTKIYGGLGIDAGVLGQADWVWMKLWAILLMTVEMPLSFVLDTVTLPVTIPVTLSR
jgi:uncharacterized protein YceK